MNLSWCSYVYYQGSAIQSESGAGGVGGAGGGIQPNPLNCSSSKQRRREKLQFPVPLWLGLAGPSWLTGIRPEERDKAGHETQQCSPGSFYFRLPEIGGPKSVFIRQCGGGGAFYFFIFFSFFFSGKAAVRRAAVFENLHGGV